MELDIPELVPDDPHANFVFWRYPYASKAIIYDEVAGYREVDNPNEEARRTGFPMNLPASTIERMLAIERRNREALLPTIET